MQYRSTAVQKQFLNQFSNIVPVIQAFIFDCQITFPLRLLEFLDLYISMGFSLKSSKALPPNKELDDLLKFCILAENYCFAQLYNRFDR